MADTGFQRFVLAPNWDARIGVENGRLQVGPADDDGVTADMVLSREVAFEILLQQLDVFSRQIHVPQNRQIIAAQIDRLRELMRQLLGGKK